VPLLSGALRSGMAHSTNKRRSVSRYIGIYMYILEVYICVYMFLYSSVVLALTYNCVSMAVVEYTFIYEHEYYSISRSVYWDRKALREEGEQYSL
jgi:hypothetical protein